MNMKNILFYSGLFLLFFLPLQSKAVFITLVDGSLTTQKFADKEHTAIVNAANENLEGGGGIDGAIWAKVGSTGHAQFLAECKMLKRKKTAGLAAKDGGYNGFGKPTEITLKEIAYVAGQAGITHAYGPLKATVADYVIHAVGPVEESTDKLRSTYQNSLERANEVGLTCIAFCPISTGIYGYDIAKATPIALMAVIEWLRIHPKTSIQEVRFVTWSEKPVEYATYKTKLSQLSPATLKTIAKEEISAQLKKSLDRSKQGKNNSLIFELDL